MKRVPVFILCALALCACNKGYDGLPIPPEQEEVMLRNWIAKISSDEFGGRKPMSPYEEITTSYLISQLDSLGIQPAFGSSYSQEVQLISTQTTFDGGGMAFKGKSGKGVLRSPDDFVGWTSRPEGRVDLPSTKVVFCGFGIDAPEFSWNDFDGVDVKGKIVLAMVNDPGFYDASLFQGKNMTYYGRWTYKFEEAAKRGAAACLVIHETDAAGYGWNVCANHVGSNLALYDSSTGNSSRLPMNGWIHKEGCR